MTLTFDFTTSIVLDVTTFNDENDGSNAGTGLSLRDAILQANANPSKEYIINLPAGTYNLTIQNILQNNSDNDSETILENRTTSGDLDIKGRVTINSQDRNNTIISGLGLQSTFQYFDFGSFGTLKTGDRIFDVASGAILNLENITVRDGLIIEDYNDQTDINITGDDIHGGAINIQPGGTVNINNSIISDNISEAQGGAINNNGILTINDSIIKNNTAEDVNLERLPFGTIVGNLKTGGGIFNNGTLKINRSTIANNFAQTEDFKLSGSNASSPQIEGAGGGITNTTSGTVTLVNSSIISNSGGLDVGGGILNRGVATLVNSTLTNNIAQQGAGIYSEGSQSSSTINNSIVAANKIQTQLTVITTEFFPQLSSNFVTETPVNFIDEFIWDLIDGNNTLIQPPQDVTPFRDGYYGIRVFYENLDPFSSIKSEITDTDFVKNILLDSNGDIQYVFNSYSGEDLDNFFSPVNGFEDQDNNLIQNIDQNFGFAYELNDNTVFLNTDFEFDEDGKLILVLSDPTINPNDTIPQIVIADKQNIFDFSSNLIVLNDDNKRLASFVRDQNNNNQVFNYDGIVRSQERRTGTRLVQLENSPLSTDITGFFNNSSSFNLIGASSVNGIFDGLNNNNVGSVNSPLDPQLQTITDSVGNVIAYQPLENSRTINAGNNSITQLRTFFGNNPVDQFGNPRINNGTVDIGSVEFGSSNTNNSDVNTVLNEGDSLLNSPIYRFQNRNVSGTYLYAGSQEAQNIRSNFPNFSEEGLAFKVSQVPNDELIPIYRFQNTSKPGTYLYAGTQERDSILTNNLNFKDEGVAFYVYGADANKGQDIYRFQNLSNPSTYLFVGETEKNNILATNNNFRLEGVAFEVGI